MKDAGHEETEKILKGIEKRITAEYQTAEREIQDKLDDYLRRFEIKDALKRKALENGLISDEEYQKWRIGQIMMSKRWDDLKNAIAKDLADVSQEARNIAFGAQPGVYAVNYNYGTYQVEKGARMDTSFTLYDKDAVRELMKDEDTFIPAPGRKVQREINEGKQIAWDKKQVQSVMMQGILQGKSIPDLATSLAETVGESDRKAAIRNARTLTTGVQNAGRVASYERANEMGIETQKQWLATLDDRTRHEHAALDGEKVDYDQPFENDFGKIMYPGDPAADPSNIFNCRCTLIASIKGFERDLSDKCQRDDRLGDMSYEDWKEGHYEERSDDVLKQDETSKTMQEIYGEEYSEYRNLSNTEEETKETTFVPATTIEEAQSYAEQFIESNFMDKTFKGKADFKGISLENANEINKALTNVYEAFPDMEKISGIKVVSPTSAAGKKAFKDGADALFAYDPIQHGIYVNGNILKNADTVEDYFKKSEEAWNVVANNLDSLSASQRAIAERYIQAGRSLVAEGDIESLFEHELGHHVEWTMLDAKTNNMLGSHMSEYAPQISGYATSSKSEYLAESFAAYMKGERDILDPQFVSFLDSKVKTEKIFALNANNLNVTWNLKLDESGKDVIIMTGKQFGKKATKHVKDYGLDVSKEADRRTFFEITQNIVQNYDEIRHGEWRGQDGLCDFYIKGDDVVIINKGEYVSTLKGGVNNERIKNARKRKV